MAKVKNRRDNHNIKRPKSHAGYGESQGTREMRESADNRRSSDQRSGKASGRRQGDQAGPRRGQSSRDSRSFRPQNSEGGFERDKGPDSNVIIGRNPVTEALKAGREIDKLLVTSREGSMIKILAMAKEQGIPVMYVEKAALDRISGGLESRPSGA